MRQTDKQNKSQTDKQVNKKRKVQKKENLTDGELVSARANPGLHGKKHTNRIQAKRQIRKREVRKKFTRKISLASARANAGLRLNKQTNRRKGKQPNKKEKSGKSF